MSELLPDVRITAYDGAVAGPDVGRATVSFESPMALVRILRAPRGLGLARAWVAGDITVRGDLHAVAIHERSLRDPALLTTALVAATRTAFALGVNGFRSAGPTGIEYRGSRPGSHSIAGDVREVDFHYGHSPEFFRHLLGPSMTYSCGIFADGATSLADAQRHKHDLICRKLRLGSESTVLDVGCGWGSFLKHAVACHGCRGVGITASYRQFEAARKHTSKTRRIEIRHGDYRQLLPRPGFSAAASIGMYEHVGEARSVNFFRRIRASLLPGSYYLNQAIVRREKLSSRTLRRNSFAQRYIFPNGQLIPLSRQLRDLEKADFNIVSVDTFGASYIATIRCWIDNLENSWNECVAIEGSERVRAWYMYLNGALTRFENGSIDLAQVLARAR